MIFLERSEDFYLRKYISRLNVVLAVPKNVLLDALTQEAVTTNVLTFSLFLNAKLHKIQSLKKNSVEPGKNCLETALTTICENGKKLL